MTKDCSITANKIKFYSQLLEIRPAQLGAFYHLSGLEDKLQPLGELRTDCDWNE
ncbi:MULTISPECIES: hypothetical protein [Nostocales]|uniref:Uncharacterized protein n=3 Tax=Nostocales TaxID=1161 RepID=A0A8S9TC58_9CYAN|nr:hypothetical protein [Tolypothrix bouteillei]KAF3889678.1 hypothetical protein DA73_0400032560 [Tolypothrix bouteillei VB521301]